MAILADGILEFSEGDLRLSTLNFVVNRAGILCFLQKLYMILT